MISEIVIVSVITMITTIITKFGKKIFRMKSHCSDCCDVVLETEPQNEND